MEFCTSRTPDCGLGQDVDVFCAAGKLFLCARVVVEVGCRLQVRFLLNYTKGLEMLWCDTRITWIILRSPFRAKHHVVVQYIWQGG